MAILRIYGARAILLLFCYHKDIESKSCEIEFTISQPILTHKRYQSFYGTIISILYNMGETNFGNSSYLLSFRHFLLFCDQQGTESDKY